MCSNIAFVVPNAVDCCSPFKTPRPDHVQLRGRKSNALFKEQFRTGKSEKDGIITWKLNLSLEVLIDPGEGGRLKGSGRWSHQRSMCEWDETVE